MANGTIHLIGVDSRNPGGIPVSLLESSPVLVLSRRFEQLLYALSPKLKEKEIIPISPISEALAAIRERLCSGNVVVLASGDPLFFGMGKRLISEFGENKLKIKPALSSLQHAFSHFAIPWNDATFISLHGRNKRNYLGTILSHHKTMLLTDQENRPEIIASHLMSFLDDRSRKYTAYVSENIGMENERFISGPLQEIARLSFCGLCCMILQRQRDESTPGRHPLGLNEDDIHHSRGLITKNEVRAAAIHALRVPENAIVWDIGAGSGSVGLEISRMAQGSLVYSIEKSAQQQENISENIDKFSAFNMKLIAGEAPEAIRQLPDPDRVFIGGSGGNLAEIIPYCTKKLTAGGRIVVTAVLEKTMQEAPKHMFECGLEVQISRIEVSRTHYPEQANSSFNPISIITGYKGNEAQVKVKTC